MMDPITTRSTRSMRTAGSSHRGTRFTVTPYKPAIEEDPRWVMDDDANRADVLGGAARPSRTGLARRTQPGVSRPRGSRASSGDLMRLFVAIAPPPAVLDE